MADKKNIKPTLTRLTSDDSNTDENSWKEPPLSWMTRENAKLSDSVASSGRRLADAQYDALTKINWPQLRELRKKRNFGQSKIAEMIGVSVPTYSKIETGKQVPSLDQAMNLVEAFGYQDRLMDFVADLDQSLREALQRSSFVALENIRKRTQQHHDLEAQPITGEVTVGNASMTVDRKRIPLHSIVDTPKIFSTEQTVQLIPEEAHLIGTPPMLAGIEDAYAMIVPNEKMHPAYSEGDTVYVHTGKLPQDGDDVVVRLTFEDREIAFIRSVWATNARSSKDGETIFFDLISWAQRDAAKMAAVAKVGNPEDIIAIMDVATSICRRNMWTLTGTANGEDTLAGTGMALPKILNADVHVIVGCQRKQGSRYGFSKFGEGPFGG